MSDQTDTLAVRLEKFGLSADEAQVYLFLLQNSDQTALQLSKKLSLGRTKVYKILESLEEKGLISIIVGERGKRFKAESYHNLEMLVKEKEYEVEELKKTKNELATKLHSLQKHVDTKSQIMHYKGKKGLKQVTWNSTKARGELFIFEILDMSAFLDYGFCEKVRQEFVRNNVTVKELTNQRVMPTWTNIHTFVQNFWDCRYIDPKELEFKIEVLIYNDVVAFYSFDTEIFCVEIQNQELAEMQKQLFGYMWKHAEKMNIGNGGKARIRL